MSNVRQRMNGTINTMLALSVMLMASSVCQADFQEGVEAYNRGDYKTALKEWLIFAEQGYAEAQYNLGVMYANGQGAPEDDTEAAKWYRKAAEQGYAEAQLQLGLMYANGRGVPKDNTEAVTWFQKAAGQGGAVAQFNLGAMYAKGEGVPENHISAYAWFNLAVAQGVKKAIEAKEFLREEMTPSQIAEAQKLSRTLFELIHGKVAKRTPPKQSSTRDLILRAQEHLKDLGYKPGPVDGIFGAKSRRALRQYQAAKELPVTGNLDDATKKAMGLK